MCVTQEHQKNFISLSIILFRSSRAEVVLGKGIMKIFRNLQENNALLRNLIEITLRHGCSPVNLLHNFRTPFPKNTFGWLLLTINNHPLLKSFADVMTLW